MPENSNASRTCQRGGFLVGPNLRLPDDPRYFQTAGAKFVVGCNRLRCNLCGEMVKQQAGYRDADPESAAAHAREIFLMPDFTQSPYVTADVNSRLYVCGCSLVILQGGSSSPFPNGTWVCAGHPPVEAGGVLPAITQQAASGFAVKVANSHLQQTINVLAITLTNGDGMLAMPANISLGGGMPGLKLWTNETTNTPIELDFSTVAGACIQLKDDTLEAF